MVDTSIGRKPQLIATIHLSWDQQQHEWDPDSSEIEDVGSQDHRMLFLFKTCFLLFHMNVFLPLRPTEVSKICPGPAQHLSEFQLYWSLKVIQHLVWIKQACCITSVSYSTYFKTDLARWKRADSMLEYQCKPETGPLNLMKSCKNNEKESKN